MGGQLRATSQPGHGSRFLLELPLEVAAPDEFQWPALAADVPAAFGRGRTALVVDPDAASREHLAEMLFAAEFNVLLAADADAATASAQTHLVHLLIVEQDLPGGSGRSLLATLQRQARRERRRMVCVLYAGKPVRRVTGHDCDGGFEFDAERQKPVFGEAWWTLLQPPCSDPSTGTDAR